MIVMQSNIKSLFDRANIVLERDLGLSLFYNELHRYGLQRMTESGQCYVSNILNNLMSMHSDKLLDWSVFVNVIFDSFLYHINIYGCSSGPICLASYNFIVMCSNYQELLTQTFLHELGHNFGLLNNYDPNDMMYINHLPTIPLAYTNRKKGLSVICKVLRDTMFSSHECLPFYPEMFSEPIKL